MRLVPGDRSGKPVDAQTPVPGVVVAGAPVPAGTFVLRAGEDRHPFVGVGVDRPELPGRVTGPEIPAPAPQGPGQCAGDFIDGLSHMGHRGELAYPLADRIHGPRTGPAMQVEPAPAANGGDLAVMPAEEVETRATTGKMDDPGLVRVQLQPERGQDLGHQQPRLLGAVSGAAPATTTPGTGVWASTGSPERSPGTRRMPDGERCR